MTRKASKPRKVHADDIEEQAQGYLAVFWNENGNKSVCKVIFADIKQAQDWAKNLLAESGATVTKVDKDGVQALAGRAELGYVFLPVILAEPDTPGKDISLDHVVTV